MAVYGKSPRGSGPAGGQVHLLAAMDHTTHAVLGQVDVDGKRNGGVEPITVGPGPASVELIVSGLVEHVRWLPAMRWADYIVGWHRGGDHAADHDVWNGVDEADQLVVIALIGMAISGQLASIACGRSR